jgi:pimeloyl-ACP methyl ester carboxylesterase
VVLLHGSGSRALTWDPVAARLAATGYRPIAVDLRGHATSERTGDYALTSLRDDVVHLLAALDLRDVVLVGHSVGGYAALAAALHAPARIAGLVLEDLAAPPPRTTPRRPADLRRLLSAGADVLAGSRDYDLRAMVSIVRQLTRPDPGWWARLGEVRQPTLVLSGGPTSCIPPRRLSDVTAAMPDARLATIPVGHRVHSLAPERFAAELSGFLDGLDDACAGVRGPGPERRPDAAGRSSPTASRASAGSAPRLRPRARPHAAPTPR